jgi:hypothetical protein
VERCSGGDAAEKISFSVWSLVHKEKIIVLCEKNCHVTEKSEAIA